MRLINCETLRLESFDTSDAPPYAILSHTWENEEVTFKDFHDTEARNKKQGWSKVVATCTLAQASGYTHAWVDSCCIDKDSSAELSEAINSMFVWYGLSEDCYAYLSDYETPDKANQPIMITPCRWFTRGWTLQELIAPSAMTFYDRNWIPIGTKITLSTQISESTKIDREILTNTNFHYLRALLDSQTIAMRMSWAATRRTKRPEDMAYCLLGLFGISTPMLYGEGGQRAFIRLQEEIIKESNDTSIFAWKEASGNSVAVQIISGRVTRMPRGILAESPTEFLGAHYKRRETVEDPEYGMTNKGLRINAEPGDRSGKALLVLNCYHQATGNSPRFLCVSLQRQADKTFARVDPDKLFESYKVPNQKALEAIYIAKRSPNATRQKTDASMRVHIEFEYGSYNNEYTFRVLNRAPHSNWDAATRAFATMRSMRNFACIERVAWKSKAGASDEFAVIAGVPPTMATMADWRPWACFVAGNTSEFALRQVMMGNTTWLAGIQRNSNEAQTLTLKTRGLRCSGASLQVQKIQKVEHDVTVMIYRIKVVAG